MLSCEGKIIILYSFLILILNKVLEFLNFLTGLVLVLYKIISTKIVYLNVLLVSYLWLTKDWQLFCCLLELRFAGSTWQILWRNVGFDREADQFISSLQSWMHRKLRLEAGLVTKLFWLVFPVSHGPKWRTKQLQLQSARVRKSIV